MLSKTYDIPFKKINRYNNSFSVCTINRTRIHKYATTYYLNQYKTLMKESKYSSLTRFYYYV